MPKLQLLHLEFAIQMIIRILSVIMPKSILLGVVCLLSLLCLQPPSSTNLQEPASGTTATASLPENPEVQIEIPKLPFIGDEKDQEREKDPLYQQIRKMMLNDLTERFPDKGLSEKAAPPSLSPEAINPVVGPRTDSITQKEWHAIELLLTASRLLDEEASQALAAGNHVRAEDRAAVARRTRAETISLLQLNMGR